METLYNANNLTLSTFVCQVCEEPARGFHFGAFTCEGCKSFFGRTCKVDENDVRDKSSTKNEPTKKSNYKLKCKNNKKCSVRGKNRTSCKACRYTACLDAGMSPQNSRYGRRSRYFKISALLDSASQFGQCLHKNSMNNMNGGSYYETLFNNDINNTLSPTYPHHFFSPPFLVNSLNKLNSTVDRTSVDLNECLINPSNHLIPNNSNHTSPHLLQSNIVPITVKNNLSKSYTIFSIANILFPIFEKHKIVPKNAPSFHNIASLAF